MDAIEILGSLLGSKAKGGGRGADILKDIFGGGRGNAPERSQPAPPRSSAPVGRSPADDSIHADDLEELLNVAVQRQSPSRSSSTPAPTASPAPSASSRPPLPTRPAPPQFQPKAHTHPGQVNPNQSSVDHSASIDSNAQALVLIRAMVSAAKADGKVSTDEQQQILEQIGDQSPQTIQFLQGEFAKSLDVRQFVWSVPLGMEEQVYTISLMAMNLDTQAEAEYLAELAHGLRLKPEVCNRIHNRYNVPPIFQG